MKVSIVWLVILTLFISACGGSGNNTETDLAPPPPQPAPPVVGPIETRSGTAARQGVSSDQSDALQLAQNNNQFVIDLYQQQSQDNRDDNLVMSPFSISNAFAMLYGGSANETKREIAETFYFLQGDVTFHQAFNTLSQNLLSQANSDAFTLNIVNAQWGERTYDFHPDYLDLLSQFYGAEVNVLDIMGQPEEARTTINQWVEEQTQSLIKDLMPEGSITPDSRLVLTNAVYFNAKWLDEFDPAQTQDRAFSTLTAGDLMVPTMSKRGQHNVYSEGEAILVELPYQNTDWSMFVVTVPAESFVAFEAALDQSQLDSMIANAISQDSIVTLPKFSFGSALDLQETLEALGMPMTFDSVAADFSAINQREVTELFVSSAVHKAFITVDESGTEAGAATGIGVGVTSLPPEYRIDQPFVFVVRHNPTKTTLFMGRVMDPLQ